MSRAVNSRRPTEYELAVFERVWRRYRNDERDLLEGGVAPAVVARDLDSTTGAVAEACVRLRDEGVLVELHGADPDQFLPRRSFAPAALVEDDGGEQR